MASPEPATQNMDVNQPKSAIPNRPQAKLPALPKGTRIQKRPLPRRVPSRPSGPFRGKGKTLGGGGGTPNGSNNPRVIYVSTSTPFMAVVKRVLKAVENGPQKTKGLPLSARIAALGVGGGATDRSGGRDAGKEGAERDGDDEVLVVGTGRAIEKTLNVAAWLDRRKELKVSLRTRSVGAVDDVVPVVGEEGDAQGGDGEDLVAEDMTRVRWVSCLEVGVRMR